MNFIIEGLFKTLIVLSVVTLVVNLIKPHWIQWIGPGKKKSNHRPITAIALGLFLVGFIGLGEISKSSSGNHLERKLGAQILSKTKYSIGSKTKRCEAGSRPGGAGATDDETSADGIRYNVRTPANYDSTFAHPLLMVYAPAHKNRYHTEKFTYLTRDATAAGFIIVYADHRRMAPETPIQLAAIPKAIQKKWCIDEDRIFLTGHSDGGTISMGIAFIPGLRDIPAAIAPSAVGIRREDLVDHSCPKPLSVMVMHSARDGHFPAQYYGKATVKWWVQCNQCNDNEAVKTVGNGCIAYSGCANGVKTWYCENDQRHSVWPGLNHDIINFFSTATRTAQ